MSRTISTHDKSPLGALIAVRLKKMGQSQKWLSKNAGITQVYLCSIMAGRANPTIKLLCKISKILNISVESLVNSLLKENEEVEHF